MAKANKAEDSLLCALPTTSWLFCTVTDGMPSTLTGSFGSCEGARCEGFCGGAALWMCCPFGGWLA